MKKIVCARCGLVNLDKFVSFPHCAACGVLLPRQAPSPWRAFWNRPVRPFYWMLAVGSGLGVLSLAIASIARETKSSGDKPLLIYANTPRIIAPEQEVKARFTLDSALENPDDNFRNVSLRLHQKTRRDFVIVTLTPKPDAIETRGRGVYYLWRELPRNTVLNLTLRPRVGKRGALALYVTLWAAEYQQFQVRTEVEMGTKNGQPIRAENSPGPIQTPAKVAR